jgi:hypothetical protein
VLAVFFRHRLRCSATPNGGVSSSRIPVSGMHDPDEPFFPLLFLYPRILSIALQNFSNFAMKKETMCHLSIAANDKGFLGPLTQKQLVRVIIIFFVFLNQLIIYH